MVNGPKIPPWEASGRAHRRMWRAIASRGRSLRKQEDPLKSPRGKAKAKATVEDGCWTEEDDETLQLGYLGSEPCLMSSPPGLREW